MCRKLGLAFVLRVPTAAASAWDTALRRLKCASPGDDAARCQNVVKHKSSTMAIHPDGGVHGRGPAFQKLPSGPPMPVSKLDLAAKDNDRLKSGKKDLLGRSVSKLCQDNRP